MAESTKPFNVAIIGGGLCGISLAIGLTKRSIPFTIYESHPSFTEIGAGINLGPNSRDAFRLIDPSLPDEVLQLATEKAPGKENLWMTLRLAVPTERFEDGMNMGEINAPHEGNMTVSRNEVLQFLARKTRPEDAKFNKKLMSFEEHNDHVTIKFEDGTEATASIVVACDGIHSNTRKALLGAEHPAAVAKFSEVGAYRAVLPMPEVEKRIGKELCTSLCYSSQLWCGPCGYIIMYPISGGRALNIGFWNFRKGTWDRPAWVIPGQKQNLLDDWRTAGENAKKLIDLVDDDVSFWATFHHSVRPDSYYKGRVCLIGDAAHAMPPHQGNGAAQAMEDAAVLAELLGGIDPDKATPDAIKALFQSYEEVRKPRFEKVATTSHEAISFWSTFHRFDLTEQDLVEFKKKADERFVYIWENDLAADADRAKSRMSELLQQAQPEKVKLQPNGHI